MNGMSMGLNMMGNPGLSNMAPEGFTTGSTQLTSMKMGPDGKMYKQEYFSKGYGGNANGKQVHTIFERIFLILYRFLREFKALEIILMELRDLLKREILTSTVEK